MIAEHELLERFERVTRAGDGRWTACCPAHEDRKPSLSIALTPDRWLLHCHAGCDTERVVAEAGLELRDLFAQERSNGHRDIVATYGYTSEQGEPLFEVVRFAPKDFRQRRPDGAGGWAWKLGGVRRVPYRLPRVLETAGRGGRVYVVEGEKDVHALERVGQVATCNPGGAGKWRPEYAKPLTGAEVVVVADRDEPGRAHARQVAASLRDLAASVELVEPTAGNDVADHLATGLGLDALVPLDAAAGDEPDGKPDGELGEVRVVSLEDFAAVEEEVARALLGQPDSAVIPENGDVMVYGDGGAGKTTLTVDLSCHLSAGDDWLGIHVERPLRVLLIENEGPRAFFRQKAARKVAAWAGSPLEGRVRVWETPWAALTLADARHRALLADQIREQEIDVVVLGPVTCAGMDEAGTLQEVRAFLRLLDEVRRGAGRPVTFVLIHHENKGGAVSGAWEGAGDTLLHVQGQGHGKTRLYVQKARWASDLHAKSLMLAWTDGEGFELEEKPERDDAAIADDILGAVRQHGGESWNKIDKEVPGNRDSKAAIRDRLLAGGQLVNAGSAKAMKLWHRDDPARPVPASTAQESAAAAPEPDIPLWNAVPESESPREPPARTTGSPVPDIRREPGTGEPPREPGTAASPDAPRACPACATTLEPHPHGGLYCCRCSRHIEEPT